jgi:signal transduction histidine kinase
MATIYSPESRAERLIAAGRVVLATCSLFAVWLDPTEPAKFASVAYSLLASYVLYALLLVALVFRFGTPSRIGRAVSHGFDLGFFSLFTYFTNGPASPFVAYFVFALVAATLRWQWRGTFWTAIVSLGTFVGLGFYYAEVLRDAAFQITPFVVRAVYLTVVAVLLGYLGRHEERTRREIAMLAAWPTQPAERSLEVVAEALLRTARAVLDAPIAVALWCDHEEPWTIEARIDGETFTMKRADAAVPALPAELAAGHFLIPEPRGAATPLVKRAQRIERLPAGSFVDIVAWKPPILGLALAGETFEGHLLFLGKRGMTSDDLLLGEVVASIVATRLDHVHLLRRLRESAASEERERLARDLHDGVLQSFTGIGLRVAATRKLAEERPAEAADRWAELQRLLADEQRDLRFFIQELASPELEVRIEMEFTSRCEEMALRIEQAFGVPVSVWIAAVPPVGKPARDLYSLIREAVVNAARHACARRVDVELGSSPSGGLAVTIRDDGTGFPFRGRFTAQELKGLKVGPRSLLERAGALGGDLTLSSSDEGSVIEIHVPAVSA